MDSIIEERALREIYLAGFQRAIAGFHQRAMRPDGGAR